MLTTSLLLMLSVADGRATFLADGAPRKIRLASDDDAPQGRTAESYAGWTRGQLQAEYDQIADARPTLALPIFLMAAGVATPFACLFYMVLIDMSSGFTALLPVVPVLVVGSIVGVALVILGIILLVRSLPERRRMGDQLDLLDNLINHGAPAPAPVPVAPPALPPPQVSLPFPITLARF